MILISDDGHDYVTKKSGGRALRLDRRLRSTSSLEVKPYKQDTNDAVVLADLGVKLGATGAQVAEVSEA